MVGNLWGGRIEEDLQFDDDYLVRRLSGVVRKELKEKNELKLGDLNQTLYDFLNETNSAEGNSSNPVRSWSQLLLLRSELKEVVPLDSYKTVFSGGNYYVLKGEELSKEAAHDAALYENMKRDLECRLEIGREYDIPEKLLNYCIEDYIEEKDLPGVISEKDKSHIRMELERDLSPKYARSF